MTAPDETLPAPDCSRAREALGRFVAGGIGVEEERFLRAHLTACEPCRDRYRESVSTVAVLGRARRHRRLEDVRLRRREAARRRIYAVGEKRGRGRYFGLRAVALLTMVIVLFTGLNPAWNVPELVVRWESGEVQAGAKRLWDGEPEGALRAGDWCVTEIASSARIEGDRGELWVGHHSQVLVEDPRRAQVRLQQGTVEVTGQATIHSQFGIARLEEGRARLDLLRGSLQIECLAGRLEWMHPGGSQVLAAGQRAHARTPGELLSVR
ncbi:MAG: zf-HC2 domain-containing protein [Planctomycetota bacterium]